MQNNFIKFLLNQSNTRILKFLIRYQIFIHCSRIFYASIQLGYSSFIFHIVMNHVRRHSGNIFVISSNKINTQKSFLT